MVALTYPRLLESHPISLTVPPRNPDGASKTGASKNFPRPSWVLPRRGWVYPCCRDCGGEVLGRLTLEGGPLCWHCFDDAYRELGVAG